MNRMSEAVAALARAPRAEQREVVLGGILAWFREESRRRAGPSSPPENPPLPPPGSRRARAFHEWLLGAGTARW